MSTHAHPHTDSMAPIDSGKYRKNVPQTFSQSITECQMFGKGLDVLSGLVPRVRGEVDILDSLACQLQRSDLLPLSLSLPLHKVGRLKVSKDDRTPSLFTSSQNNFPGLGPLGGRDGAEMGRHGGGWGQRERRHESQAGEETCQL